MVYLYEPFVLEVSNLSSFLGVLRMFLDAFYTCSYTIIYCIFLLYCMFKTNNISSEFLLLLSGRGPPSSDAFSVRTWNCVAGVRQDWRVCDPRVHFSIVHKWVCKKVGFPATFDRVSVFAQSNIIAFLFQAYITLTRNGNDLYTERTLPGQRVTWILHNTVNEGEYACYVHTRGFKVYRTESSNVIGIYSTYHFYTIPPIQTYFFNCVWHSRRLCHVSA